MRVAALLRGVNVGGNRRLAMADLRRFVEGLGYRDVRTLLASGNVVFTADEPAAAIEARLAQEAMAALGLATDWLVRTGTELADVLAADPFPDAAAERPSQYTIVFHRGPVPAGLVERLDHPGPERLRAIGRELFIDYAGRLSDSKLGPAMTRARFPGVATARNWNTVRKLADATR